MRDEVAEGVAGRTGGGDVHVGDVAVGPPLAAGWPPEDGCASYRACYEGLAQLEADTHLHVHKENNVLFPAVLGRQASPMSG